MNALLPVLLLAAATSPATDEDPFHELLPEGTVVSSETTVAGITLVVLSDADAEAIVELERRYREDLLPAIKAFEDHLKVRDVFVQRQSEAGFAVALDQFERKIDEKLADATRRTERAVRGGGEGAGIGLLFGAGAEVAFKQEKAKARKLRDEVMEAGFGMTVPDVRIILDADERMISYKKGDNVIHIPTSKILFVQEPRSRWETRRGRPVE